MVSGPPATPIAGRELSTNFFIGGDQSGSHTHFHSLAFNVIASGQKRWWIARPHHAFYTKESIGSRKARVQHQQEQTEQGAAAEGASSLSALSWPLTVSRADQFVTFIQKEMDLLIIPSDFAHATENYGFTVGMAVETTHCPTGTTLTGGPEDLYVW